jgi:uncharacterized protein (TIGR02284 family)
MTTTTPNLAGISSAHAGMLNDLLELNRDSVEGFAKTKELAESPKLKQICASAEMERRAQVAQLEPLVRAAGGRPEKDGSAKGTLHRTWLKVREALTPDSDKALVNEAERGEDEIRDAYVDAMKQPLPPTLKSVIEMQAKQVMAVHDTFSDLKHGRVAL